MPAQVTAGQSIAHSNVVDSNTSGHGDDEIDQLVAVFVLPTSDGEDAVEGAASIDLFGNGQTYLQFIGFGFVGNNRLIRNNRLIGGYGDHIRIIIQCGLPLQQAIIGNQRIGSLVGGHGIGACASAMLKLGFLFNVVGQQIVDGRIAVLDETGIGVGIDAPGGAGNDGPGAAFGGLTAAIGETAIIQLVFGQPVNSGLASSCYFRLIAVGIQCHQSHTGDIHIGRLGLGSDQGPATVIVLGRNDGIHALLADGGIGSFIIAAIQSDQCPDGAVHALLADPVDTVGTVGLHQIPVAHRSGISADGSQCHDQTGVVGGLTLIQRTVHIQLCGLGVYIFHNAVVVVSKILAVICVVATTGQTEHGPFAKVSTEGRLGDSRCLHSQGSIQHSRNILRLPGCFRFGCAGNSDLCESRGRNNARFAGFAIVFAADVGAVLGTVAAITPNVISTGIGEGDLSVAIFVGGHRAFGLTKDLAVVDFKILCILHPGLAKHQITEGVLQFYGQRFAGIGGVIVGVVVVFIGKQMETAQLIPQEAIAAEACYIQEVTGFQHDAVGGSANGHKITLLAFVHREVAVLEIYQIFGETKDATAEIGATGQGIKGYLAPIAAVEFFVGVDQQLQSGGFVFTIAVGIVEHILKTIFGQVDGGNGAQRNGNISNGIAVLVVDIMAIKADGQVNNIFLRLCFGSTCADGRKQSQHHHQRQQQTQNFFTDFHKSFFLSWFTEWVSFLWVASTPQTPTPEARFPDRP